MIELTITPYEPGRPVVPVAPKGFYEQLGEEGIRKVVSDHYDKLVNSSIAKLFPPGGKPLESAKKFSADFLIQICGGPAYYKEGRGEPKLVQRHTPFKITPSARVTWLESYREVLLQQDLTEDVLKSMWAYLDVFSIWMVNTAEYSPNGSGFSFGMR